MQAMILHIAVTEHGENLPPQVFLEVLAQARLMVENGLPSTMAELGDQFEAWKVTIGLPEEEQASLREGVYGETMKALFGRLVSVVAMLETTNTSMPFTDYLAMDQAEDGTWHYEWIGG